MSYYLHKKELKEAIKKLNEIGIPNLVVRAALYLEEAGVIRLGDHIRPRDRSFKGFWAEFKIDRDTDLFLNEELTSMVKEVETKAIAMEKERQRRRKQEKLQKEAKIREILKTTVHQLAEELVEFVKERLPEKYETAPIYGYIHAQAYEFWEEKGITSLTRVNSWLDSPIRMHMHHVEYSATTILMDEIDDVIQTLFKGKMKGI